MAKKTKFKVGDKVRSNDQMGIWDLVWYKKGDTTCAIQNDSKRVLAKISQLKLVGENEIIAEDDGYTFTEKPWMKNARKYLDENKNDK